MPIIGCDYHLSFQQIAFVDTETGELKEQRLAHREGAEEFYRALAAGGQQVRVGMEASGHARWFETTAGGVAVREWSDGLLIVGLPENSRDAQGRFDYSVSVFLNGATNAEGTGQFSRVSPESLRCDPYCNAIWYRAITISESGTKKNEKNAQPGWPGDLTGFSGELFSNYDAACFYARSMPRGEPLLLFLKPSLNASRTLRSTD